MIGNITSNPQAMLLLSQEQRDYLRTLEAYESQLITINPGKRKVRQGAIISRERAVEIFDSFVLSSKNALLVFSRGHPLPRNLLAFLSEEIDGSIQRCEQVFHDVYHVRKKPVAAMDEEVEIGPAEEKRLRYEPVADSPRKHELVDMGGDNAEMGGDEMEGVEHFHPKRSRNYQPDLGVEGLR